jgi:hypothetical protein
MTITLQSAVFAFRSARTLIHERNYRDDFALEGNCLDNTIICTEFVAPGEYLVWLSDISLIDSRSSSSITNVAMLEPLVLSIAEPAASTAGFLLNVETTNLFRLTMFDESRRPKAKERITLYADNKTVSLETDERGSITLLDNPTGYRVELVPGSALMVENLPPHRGLR